MSKFQMMLVLRWIKEGLPSSIWILSGQVSRVTDLEIAG